MSDTSLFLHWHFFSESGTRRWRESWPQKPELRRGDSGTAAESAIFLAASEDRSRLLLSIGGKGHVLMSRQKDERFKAMSGLQWSSTWQSLGPALDRVIGMSPDGTWLFRLTGKNGIRLWDVDLGQEVPAMGTLGWYDMPISPALDNTPGVVLSQNWTALGGPYSGDSRPRPLLLGHPATRHASPERDHFERNSTRQLMTMMQAKPDS